MEEDSSADSTVLNQGKNLATTKKIMIGTYKISCTELWLIQGHIQIIPKNTPRVDERKQALDLALTNLF